jgi:hypothetical protein
VPSNILLYLIIFPSPEREVPKISHPNLQACPCGQVRPTAPCPSTLISTNANTDQPDIHEYALSANHQDTTNKSRAHKDLSTVSNFLSLPSLSFLHKLTRHMITPVHLTNPHPTRRASLTSPLNHLFRLPILSSPHLRTFRCPASRINPLFVLGAGFVFVPVHVVADAETVGAGGADEEDAVGVFLAG